MRIRVGTDVVEGGRGGDLRRRLPHVGISPGSRVELDARDSTARAALHVPVGGELRGAEAADGEPASSAVAAWRSGHDLDDSAERTGPELGSEDAAAHDQAIEER